MTQMKKRRSREKTPMTKHPDSKDADAKHLLEHEECVELAEEIAEQVSSNISGGSEPEVSYSLTLRH